MKVLWITNIVLPEAQKLLTGEGALKSSGGWLLGAMESIVNQPNVTLIVASLSPKVIKLTRLEGEKVIYYLLPYGKGNMRINHDYEPLWKQIKDKELPDVIHLHGTEFSHGLAYLEACGAEHVCVSIQGLTSAAFFYYCYGISWKEILRSITVGTLFWGGILKGYREYKSRGKCEVGIIRRVNHIIGRTSWDRARTWAINPNAVYHHGGETLRPFFYSGRTWQYSECIPHSIFLSQASNPIKGLHMVLRAMPLIIRHYPDATIRIAGRDITNCSTWKHRLMLNDYGKIIRRLIRNNGLEGRVVFTGSLDGEGMRSEYLRSNVFVCPSTIENSPNSLGEAQLLGVPVIASYVGGIPDMMKNDVDHLYRFEEVEMLARKIVDLFDKQDTVDTEAMRLEALRRHDPETNAKELIEIYNEVNL